MADFNKVLLIGRITQDLKLSKTGNDTSVCNMSLATNRVYKNRNGDVKKDTTFVEVVVWDRQAETCVEYLEKGREVLVEGRLQLDTWEDKTTGKERQQLKVVAERVQFLSGRRTRDNENETEKSWSHEETEESIPF